MGITSRSFAHEFGLQFESQLASEAECGVSVSLVCALFGTVCLASSCRGGGVGPLRICRSISLSSFDAASLTRTGSPVSTPCRQSSDGQKIQDDGSGRAGQGERRQPSPAVTLRHVHGIWMMHGASTKTNTNSAVFPGTQRGETGSRSHRSAGKLGLLDAGCVECGGWQRSLAVDPQ